MVNMLALSVVDREFESWSGGRSWVWVLVGSNQKL